MSMPVKLPDGQPSASSVERGNLRTPNSLELALKEADALKRLEALLPDANETQASMTAAPVPVVAPATKQAWPTGKLIKAGVSFSPLPHRQWLYGCRFSAG